MFTLRKPHKAGTSESLEDQNGIQRWLWFHQACEWQGKAEILPCRKDSGSNEKLEPKDK